jgi:hypothetical protein
VDQTIAKREKEAESGVGYLPGQVGGRKRAGDGKELKWRVTFPELKHGRGTVPFFCQDLTPRNLRVSMHLTISGFLLIYPSPRLGAQCRR